ncbi:hypothetical protein PIB30_050568 [Stylosanthes scabra]|uniref:Uncharacterized protein n=1 Tax=Stylosanthes scabra TaxID=79078 RepID=A0ABU6RHV7_9FABA|nr:hypothetical protein [Stylosanthes scabra]
MVYCGAELVVAAYILSEDPDKQEKLVTHEHCMGTCEILQSLVPGQVVKEDHMALTPDKIDSRMVDYIKDRYMGKYEDVLKVTDKTRMSIALELVVGEHNTRAEEVKE